MPLGYRSRGGRKVSKHAHRLALVVVLPTVVLCAAAAAPGAASAVSGQPIEVLKVDTGRQSQGRGGVTTGEVPLEKGKHYKLVVSGTFSDSTVNDPHPVTNFYDAFYCFMGCTSRAPGDNFWVAVGSSNFDDVDEFSRPGGPVFTPSEPPYNDKSDHAYTVDFYAPDSGVLKAGTSDQVTGCGQICPTFKNTGTITISIYGDQPPPSVGGASSPARSKCSSGVARGKRPSAGCSCTWETRTTPASNRRLRWRCLGGRCCSSSRCLCSRSSSSRWARMGG